MPVQGREQLRCEVVDSAKAQRMPDEMQLHALICVGMKRELGVVEQAEFLVGCLPTRR